MAHGLTRGKVSNPVLPGRLALYLLSYRPMHLGEGETSAAVVACASAGRLPIGAEACLPEHAT
jgi:hypothetical protein